MKDLNELKEQLLLMQDLQYKNFHSALMPGVEKERVIGIRTPLLRAFAKRFAKSELKSEFLKSLPHYYYEENNLHAFLIEECKDYNECVLLLNEFLPYVDNWATCDMMNPKILLKDKKLLFQNITSWINSGETFAVRFAVVMAMRAFLGENYSSEAVTCVANIKSDEYYVNSAIGWFFATALTNNFDLAIDFITQNKLCTVAHNLAIKKARESLRIEKSKKDYLNTLKRKG